MARLARLVGPRPTNIFKEIFGELGRHPCDGSAIGLPECSGSEGRHPVWRCDAPNQTPLVLCDSCHRRLIELCLASRRVRRQILRHFKLDAPELQSRARHPLDSVLDRWADLLNWMARRR